MFPSSFDIINTIDIDNLKVYEIAGYKIKEEMVAEKHIQEMDSIFNELKNRILVTKADFYKICRETKKELFNTKSENVLLNTLAKAKSNSQCKAGRHDLNESSISNERAAKGRLYLEHRIAMHNPKVDLSINLPTIKCTLPQQNSSFEKFAMINTDKKSDQLPLLHVSEVALRPIYKKKHTVNDLRNQVPE
jgi:hypothetical protein